MSVKKIGIISFIVLLIVVVLYTAGPSLLAALLESRINAAIGKFKKEGIIIHYDSLYGLPDNVVFDNIDILVHNDDKYCSGGQSRVQIEKVKITGFKILPILLKHELKLDSIILTKPGILYTDAKAHNDAKKKHKKSLEKIFINHALIKDASFKIVDSAACKPSFTADFASEFNGVSISDLDRDSIKWFSNDAKVSALRMEFPDVFYSMTVREIACHMDEKKFSIDSINIIPAGNKQVFAEKSKHQTDRIEGSIPFIKGNGFEITSRNKALFHARSIALAFSLDVFRDKHYPFHGAPKSLPITFLHNLPVLLQIDSVTIDKSYVSYEELQNDGVKPGKVFFDNIKARIENISNCSDKKTAMHVTATFMDDGDLDASFLFPSKPEQAYSVDGRLANFALPKANSMLKPAANAKIETGKLEEMKFHFVYNDTRADGKLELNYSDLKMTSLANHQGRVNKFLTFLLRLVLRRDMDDNLPTNKKTGDILFYRDKHRSIFHYWWRSILSGIKSVYNLDKFQTPDKKK